MTTIILTIIGILLAAAAALMVIFYGGDAFNSGQTGAQANTIQNAGTNLISAIQIYKANNGSTNIAAQTLTTMQATTCTTGGACLKELPSLPTGVTQTLTGPQYTVASVPDVVCQRINANLKLTGITSATVPTANKMLCVPNATAGAVGAFYANA